VVSKLTGCVPNPLEIKKEATLVSIVPYAFLCSLLLITDTFACAI
jgi:hypothetical protein